MKKKKNKGSEFLDKKTCCYAVVPSRYAEPTSCFEKWSVFYHLLLASVNDQV